MHAIVDDPQLDGRTRRCIANLTDAVSGLLGVALVDHARGTSMHAVGSTVDMELAVSGGSELLALKMNLLERLDLGGSLEDMLTVTDARFCIIHPLDRQRFLYVVVDRKVGNLAMARRFVSAAAAELLV